MSPPTPSHPAEGPRGSKIGPPPPYLEEPAVDERLVMPETRYEIIEGEVVYVAPADESHGTAHASLAALLSAHAAPGFSTAVDMLTRTSKTGDMAPDASVFPTERDPVTGGRRLEQLAFEVVSTERLSHAALKARSLAARGVRRIFAIDVERRRALEWSRATDAWEILATDGAVADEALAVAIPIRALVNATSSDDAVATALLAKKNPVIEGALATVEARGEQRGVVQGKAYAVLAILSGRGLKVSPAIEAQIRATTDEARIDAWLACVGTCASIEALLAL